MRKTHPNLVYIPATKDKKEREKPAHYMTELTINYKRVRRFAGSTKEEALIYLGELRKAAKEGRLDELIRPPKALPGSTFGEYAQGVLESAEWQEKRSCRRDETSLDALNKVFKNVPLADIKSGAVRTYMTKRTKDDGRQPATANRELSFLKSILYKAEYDEIIPTNPIRGRRVKRLVEANGREQKILELNITDEKQIKLIESAEEEWFRVFLELALTVGMRLGEILKAKWKHFSLPLLTLRIPAENAKSKKERIVPLDAVLAVDLDSQPKISEYIFPLRDGRQRKDVRKPFKAACDKVGILTGRADGICFHDLRHLATFHILKHKDAVTTARILGWSSLAMLDRYCHPGESDKREAVEAAAGDLGRNQTRQKDVNAHEGRAEERPAELAQGKLIQ
jgi:integrase